MELGKELERITATIKSLEEEQREIYRQSLEAPETEKICSDFVAEELSQEPQFKTIEYPITINGIDVNYDIHVDNDNAGYLVKVRPCGDEYKCKTYLGVALGALPLSLDVRRNRDSGVLHIGPGMHNPAMWVPSLGKIVWGCGSWWGRVNSVEELKDISDADIDSVWYVQSLKALAEKIG